MKRTSPKPLEQIVAMRAAGWTLAAIAETLDLSVSTIQRACRRHSVKHTRDGEKRRRFNTKCGLTQVQLAEKLGVPQSYVSKYERGERRLDYVEVRRICDRCGVNIEDFAQMVLVRRKRRSLDHDLTG